MERVTEAPPAEEVLRIEYIPLDLALLWEDNLKRHDIPKLVESIERYGFKDPPKFEPSLNDGRGGIVVGNGRFEALSLMRREGYPVPRGIVVVEEVWTVPVVFGVDAASTAAAEAYGIDHNAVTLAGGSFTPSDFLKVWEEGIIQQVKELSAARNAPVMFDAVNLSLLIDASMTPPADGWTDFDTDTQREAVLQGAEDQRAAQVDIIYTQSATWGSGCCLACQSGWMYGVQSGSQCCKAAQFYDGHRLEFIDNEFKAYDHQVHADYVKKYHPKYCTACDILTQAQCTRMGIAYHPLGQILDWAEELSEYADNVIVIPKYDCIDQIPEKFMLGYSVPTSYGGTPLPFKAFQGRRIHLLGGSPNRQIAFWQALPNDVVSLDNNYILKDAKFGSVWCQDGHTRSLAALGFGTVQNPLYVSLAITLGNMAAYFHKAVAAEGLRTGADHTQQNRR